MEQAYQYERFKPARKQEYRPCPRCSSRLYVNVHTNEPECRMCGYADYAKKPTDYARDKSVMASALKYVVRYCGPHARLEDYLVHVERTNGRSEATMWRVKCPFCGGNMFMTKLSGDRKRKEEIRFACEQKHRISLFQTTRTRDITTDLYDPETESAMWHGWK